MTDDTLTVTGGVGGVTAHYDDMHACASDLAALASTLMDRAGLVGAVATSAAVLEGAALAPATAAQVAQDAAAVTAGPHSLAAAAAHLTASSLSLRAAVLAYQTLDEALAAQQWLLETGGAIPNLLFGGDMGANWLQLGADLGAGPLGWARLPGWAKQSVADLTDNLYDNPWIVDGVIRDLPFLLNAASNGLLVTNPLLFGLFAGTSAKEGGRFPPATFEDATRNLLGVGSLFGLFTNGTASAKPMTPGFVPPGEKVPLPTNVYALLAGVNSAGAGENEGRRGEIRIMKVHGADGLDRYVVEIPGTQEWGPEAGQNPIDTTNNLRLMAGTGSAQNQAILDAMHQAGIAADAPVMLVGHSQGGITAASLASDPGVRQQFNITNIVTAGSPVGRFPIPDDVGVLSLEHTRDAVPRLDGTPNPDRPNWVTVQRDADGVATDKGPISDVASTHNNTTYYSTARLVDASSNPSIVAAKTDMSPFLTADTSAVTVQDYQLTRTP